MPAYFFDSSALVKFYVNETGTVWVRSFTDSEDNLIHVASLAKVETVSALTRRLRRLEIKQAEFDDACDELAQDFASQYRVVALTEEIIEEAGEPGKKTWPPRLRRGAIGRCAGHQPCYFADRIHATDTGERRPGTKRGSRYGRTRHRRPKHALTGA